MAAHPFFVGICRLAARDGGHSQQKQGKNAYLVHVVSSLYLPAKRDQMCDM
jgi:hypothetical protein